MCVLILLYMRPHTAAYVSAYCCICVPILRDAAHSSVIDAATYCYMCVRILLYMCPHPAIYVCSGAAHSIAVPRRIRMLTYADVC